jgi:hypothetical protein
MNPSFPIYIVSKGRADTRLTAKALEAMRVDYRIVVEAHELEAYAAVIERRRIIVLDPDYQHAYRTCDQLGDAKSYGPGPARNFAWQHSISRGAPYHWVIDDNIRGFWRLLNNRKVPMADGTGFKVMEDFVARYDNVAMAGPSYSGFTKRKQKVHPLIFNTRIYSCNLIRNDVPFRWRGRYNEDTILSLDMLKAGWCTVQFNAFLQDKMLTQSMRGGNTAEFYAKEGTEPKSRMLVEQHPDVADLMWRFGRKHHLVDYKRFRRNRLRLHAGLHIADAADEYGLRVIERASA